MIKYLAMKEKEEKERKKKNFGARFLFVKCKIEGPHIGVNA